MLHTRFAMAAAVALFLSIASHQMGVAAERTPASDSPQTVDPARTPISSKLYESVLGYVDGIRGKAPEKRTRRSEKPGEQRRIAGNIKRAESEPSRIMERERDLIRTRMERQEWEMALGPIERALDAAERTAATDDRQQFRQWLKEAKARAEGPPEKAVSSPGEIVNAIGMRLVVIPAGTFTMGSSSSERRRVQNEWNFPDNMVEPETPEHSVRISRPFLMGKYEVTAGQFKRFVEETGYRTVAETQGGGWVYDKGKKHWVKKNGAQWKNPGFEVWEDHPVTMVARSDAEAFCTWLSKKDGRRYYLPSEAQWEYASRGGKEHQRFPWGDDYPDGKKLNIADMRSPVPWADRTVDDRHGGPAPAGSYKPNGFWLYDMAGNVWEMCSDVYNAQEYSGRTSGTATDPSGPKKGDKIVVRGGNWAFEPAIARNAFRTGIPADQCSDVTGFRVAAEAMPGETPRNGARAEASRKDSVDASEVAGLLDRVKSLVSEGRRAEARRLAEQWTRSNGAKGTNPERTAGIVQEALDAMIDLTEDRSIQSFNNSLGMKMIRIPAGAFVMGSSEADIAWAMGTLAQGQPVSLENEYPFHKVRISRPFYMSATEVTVGQFQAFVDETGYVTDSEDSGGGQVFNERDNRFEVKDGSSWKNPGWKISANQPVAMVSYNDAQAFVEWLSAKDKIPYKLPTEAQWEYACRGGLSNAQFPWGDDSPDARRANYADTNTDYEWRDRNTDDGYKYVAPVGTYEANGYGLYDMAGNVLEWVRDHYGEDYFRYSPEIDPEGPGHGENRVTKGGEWTFGPVNLRCAFRGWSRPDLAFFNTGFRVVIELGLPGRTVHFAENFLTREWVPGPDQRAVAEAVAREKERELPAARAAKAQTAKPKPQDVPVVKGVMVIDLTPKSDARKVGLRKGDVIIEYNGTGDLSSEKFLALTAQTRNERVTPVLVFIRDGYEHTVKVARGMLGISLMDTTLRGPFKKQIQRETPPPPADDDRKRSKPQEWT